MPAAFRGDPGRRRRLARVARAPSWAGSKSICFKALWGFLNRSLLFYSLWDLEKPVVPDNPWTCQHRPSSGSPGAHRCPPRSSRGGGGPAPPAVLGMSLERGWGAHSTLSCTLGSCFLLKVTCPWPCRTWGVQGGPSPDPAPGLGWLLAPGLFCPGTVCSQSRRFPFQGEPGVGCRGVCGAVHPLHTLYTRMRLLQRGLLGVRSPSSGTKLLVKPRHHQGGRSHDQGMLEGLEGARG